MHIELSASYPAVEVLYEDDAMLAVNKPAGLLVAPDRWDKKRENLMGLLRGAWPGYLANVHRLDRETSGVLLLAKSKKALTELCRQFQERTTLKHYAALVQGAPPLEAMTIELPIAPSRVKPGLSEIRKSGKPAETAVWIEESFLRHSLLRVEPRTGRTHQVRVHLRAAGCAILCDPDYGDGRPLLLSELKRDYKPKPGGSEKPLIGRLALHAGELTVRSPGQAAALTVTAPWPVDFALAVKYLRKFAR